jgi:hypothetical protein
MLSTIRLFILSTVFLATQSLAAAGPTAKGFGADDWLDKLYVVFTVIGLVAIITTILVILILRKNNN